jgi:N-acetylglucosamine kinase-like BadF-type ATPase
MTELSPGAQRAADRIKHRLKTSRREYQEALFALVPFVEEAARSGDELARRLIEDVERARVRMVSENMAAADVLH